MDRELVLTFVEALAFFGVLGWAVDTWLRSKIVFLYPAFGLLAFGAITVPLTYLWGKFDLTVILTGVGIIIALGVVGTWKFGIPHHPRILWRPQSLFLGVIAAGLLGLCLVQSSLYLIPGGIDSAIHSSIIRGILVFEQSLRGTYPLGMHISIYSIERIFDARQELVFLSLYILFYTSAIAGLAVLADRYIRRPIAGYIALAAGIIDVSLYNNFLNGSGTHLAGVFLTVLLVLGATLLRPKAYLYRLIGLTALFTFAWHFHYPTLFYAMITLWALRIASRETRSLVYLTALGLSIALSIPLQFKLFQDPSYGQSVIPGVIVISLVEIGIFFLSRRIGQIIQHRAALTIIGAISCWLFYTYADNFLFLPTWYGTWLIVLAFFGIVAAVMHRTSLAIGGLLSLLGTLIFYAVLNQPFIPGLTKVMIELGYYYGFTVSLLLLAIAGITSIIRLIPGQKPLAIFLSIAVIINVLIVASRTYDRPFITSLIPGDKPISRYESSGGFGIFYTANDAKLAEWVKKNVPRDGIIANPGGLYNSWAVLTERETLYATYNVPTIDQPEKVLSNLSKLITGDLTADVDELLRRRVKYVLLPEKFSVAIYHPRATLLRTIGQSRFYSLHATTVSDWLTVPIGASTTPAGIKITSDGQNSCRYCGNVFYFSQQDMLQQTKLGPTNSLVISLPKSLPRERYALYIDHDAPTLNIKRNGQPVEPSDNVELATVRPGDMISINNGTDSNIYIRAIGFLGLDSE